ncbi:MAG: hypothetical protein ACHQ6U_04945 [Thermodesulfobacteriota bacterium]
MTIKIVSPPPRFSRRRSPRPVTKYSLTPIFKIEESGLFRFSGLRIDKDEISQYESAPEPGADAQKKRAYKSIAEEKCDGCS